MSDINYDIGIIHKCILACVEACNSLGLHPFIVTHLIYFLLVKTFYADDALMSHL